MRKIIIIVVVAIIVIILLGVAIYFIVKSIKNRHKTIGGAQGYDAQSHSSLGSTIWKKKDSIFANDVYRRKLKLLSKRNLINFTFDSIEYMPFTISYLYKFYIKDKDKSLGMTTEEQNQLDKETKKDDDKKNNVKFFHTLFYGMLFFYDDTVNEGAEQINPRWDCKNVNELEPKSYFNGMTIEKFNKIINGNPSKTPREIKF